MPTFKGDYVQYQQQLTPEQNLQALFEHHNAFVERLSAVLNNLDAQNFSENYLNNLSAEVE